jgi:acyl-CoA thioesterase-1
MCDMGDLRVCFIGDSFVAGVGDPEHLGWVGRLAARSSRAGCPLTAYNLGVRRQTSRDVSHRWLLECQQRLPETADGRVVVSFGVNDTTDDGTGPRVPADESGSHLADMLHQAAERGWVALVVGPPPVADAQHNQRIEHLDALFRTGCPEAAVPYVSVLSRCAATSPRARRSSGGDGAHPAAGGYQHLAKLVWPTWHGWATTALERHSSTNRS